VKLRLSGNRTLHVGYCYNVLPGESVAALCEQARRICGPVRAKVGVARMGVGLWIAQPAAVELRDPAARDALRDALAREGLYVFTLNGFPYGGFHAPRVKERVFEPTWADDARVTYTLDLAAILAELLPDDVAAGSISTVPLGPATVDRARAGDGLRRLADGLADVETSTGRRIALAIEPEPGAGFERADVLAAYLRDLGAGDRVGICFDCCHAAVVDEDPAHAFAAFAAAGVSCPKIQISSALVVPDPANDDTRAALAAFDEPRFLHQVRCARGGAMDLPDALAGLDRGVPWRVHFHVPVHETQIDRFATSRAVIESSLAAAFAAGGEVPHLEVETYTWNVLPEGKRPRDDAGLVDGIARELTWTVDRLSKMGASL
jgi:sugar phosphate isomerase/epimerase